MIILVDIVQIENVSLPNYVTYCVSQLFTWFSYIVLLIMTVLCDYYSCIMYVYTDCEMV